MTAPMCAMNEQVLRQLKAAVHATRASLSDDVDVDLTAQFMDRYGLETNELLSVIKRSWNTGWLDDKQSFAVSPTEALQLGIKLGVTCEPTCLECVRYIQKGSIQGRTAIHCVSMIRMVVMSYLGDAGGAQASLQCLEALATAIIDPFAFEDTEGYVHNGQQSAICLDLLPAILTVMQSLRRQHRHEKCDLRVLDRIFSMDWSMQSLLILSNFAAEIFSHLKKRHRKAFLKKIEFFCDNAKQNSDDFPGVLRVCTVVFEMSGDEGFGHMIRKIFCRIDAHNVSLLEILLEQIFSQSSQACGLLVQLLETIAYVSLTHSSKRTSKEPNTSQKGSDLMDESSAGRAATWGCADGDRQIKVFTFEANKVSVHDVRLLLLLSRISDSASRQGDIGAPRRLAQDSVCDGSAAAGLEISDAQDDEAHSLHLSRAFVTLMFAYSVDSGDLGDLETRTLSRLPGSLGCLSAERTHTNTCSKASSSSTSSEPEVVSVASSPTDRAETHGYLQDALIYSKQDSIGMVGMVGMVVRQLVSFIMTGVPVGPVAAPCRETREMRSSSSSSSSSSGQRQGHGQSGWAQSSRGTEIVSLCLNLACYPGTLASLPAEAWTQVLGRCSSHRNGHVGCVSEPHSPAHTDAPPMTSRNAFCDSFEALSLGNVGHMEAAVIQACIVEVFEALPSCRQSVCKVLLQCMSLCIERMMRTESATLPKGAKGGARGRQGATSSSRGAMNAHADGADDATWPAADAVFLHTFLALCERFPVEVADSGAVLQSYMNSYLLYPVKYFEAVYEGFYKLCPHSPTFYNALLAIFRKGLAHRDRRYKLFAIRGLVRVLSLVPPDRQVPVAQVICAAFSLPIQYRRVLYTEITQLLSTSKRSTSHSIDCTGMADPQGRKLASASSSSHNGCSGDSLSANAPVSSSDSTTSICMNSDKLAPTAMHGSGVFGVREDGWMTSTSKFSAEALALLEEKVACLFSRCFREDVGEEGKEDAVFEDVNPESGLFAAYNFDVSQRRASAKRPRYHASHGTQYLTWNHARFDSSLCIESYRTVKGCQFSLSEDLCRLMALYWAIHDECDATWAASFSDSLVRVITNEHAETSKAQHASCRALSATDPRYYFLALLHFVMEGFPVSTTGFHDDMRGKASAASDAQSSGWQGRKAKEAAFMGTHLCLCSEVVLGFIERLSAYKARDDDDVGRRDHKSIAKEPGFGIVSCEKAASIHKVERAIAELSCAYSVLQDVAVSMCLKSNRLSPAAAMAMAGEEPLHTFSMEVRDHASFRAAVQSKIEGMVGDRGCGSGLSGLTGAGIASALEMLGHLAASLCDRVKYIGGCGRENTNNLVSKEQPNSLVSPSTLIGSANFLCGEIVCLVNCAVSSDVKLDGKIVGTIAAQLQALYASLASLDVENRILNAIQGHATALWRRSRQPLVTVQPSGYDGFALQTFDSKTHMNTLTEHFGARKEKVRRRRRGFYAEMSESSEDEDDNEEEDDCDDMSNWTLGDEESIEARVSTFYRTIVSNLPKHMQAYHTRPDIPIPAVHSAFLKKSRRAMEAAVGEHSRYALLALRSECLPAITKVLSLNGFLHGAPLDSVDLSTFAQFFAKELCTSIESGVTLRALKAYIDLLGFISSQASASSCADAVRPHIVNCLRTFNEPHVGTVTAIVSLCLQFSHDEEDECLLMRALLCGCLNALENGCGDVDDDGDDSADERSTDTHADGYDRTVKASQGNADELSQTMQVDGNAGSNAGGRADVGADSRGDGRVGVGADGGVVCDSSASPNANPDPDPSPNAIRVHPKIAVIVLTCVLRRLDEQLLRGRPTHVKNAIEAVLSLFVPPKCADTHAMTPAAAAAAAAAAETATMAAADDPGPAVDAFPANQMLQAYTLLHKLFSLAVRDCGACSRALTDALRARAAARSARRRGLDIDRVWDDDDSPAEPEPVEDADAVSEIDTLAGVLSGSKQPVTAHESASGPDSAHLAKDMVVGGHKEISAAPRSDDQILRPDLESGLAPLLALVEPCTVPAWTNTKKIVFRTAKSSAEKLASALCGLVKVGEKHRRNKTAVAHVLARASQVLTRCEDLESRLTRLVSDMKKPAVKELLDDSEPCGGKPTTIESLSVHLLLSAPKLLKALRSVKTNVAATSSSSSSSLKRGRAQRAGKAADSLSRLGQSPAVAGLEGGADDDDDDDDDMHYRDKTYLASLQKRAYRGFGRDRRIRSRNPVIDQWLEGEKGDDAYADLEDFVV